MENLVLGAIKAITFIYDVITYPLYLLCQHPWYKKEMSFRPKAEFKFLEDGKSLMITPLLKPQETHSEFVNARIDTIEKMMNFVSHKYENKKCLGTREMLSEEEETLPDGKVFKKCTLGKYKWRTYEEVNKEATDFGYGLRVLGIKPNQNIVIFAETRAEWMIAAQACFKQNFTVVTLYATLGEEGIIHGINETESAVVLTSHDLLPKLGSIIEKTPEVKIIIYMESQLEQTDTSVIKTYAHIYSFKEIVKKGENHKIDAQPPTTNDVAIIMYTSGSTGIPKGVYLSHKNMVSSTGAFTDAVPTVHTDVFLAILPLAHVFELLCEIVCLLYGISIGYSSPFTMVDTSTKIKSGTKGDASVLKPTCFSAVPLVLDRIYKAVKDKVAHGSSLNKALFKFAYDYKMTWMYRGFTTPLLDFLVFSKIQNILGGKVRIILSGGAPLSPETHEMIRICVTSYLYQGYGLTETCSCASILDSMDMSLGRVGAPATVCQIKLVDWEEENYKVQDYPCPRGEIIVGGHNVSKGYFKNPTKTEEDFYFENNKMWFRTGDIGECYNDGVIKIIDRKKDLVKLQTGEYVSLAKVETQLKLCALVDNICVIADPMEDHTVAIVVPSQPHLKNLTSKLEINQSFDKLCSNPDVVKEFLNNLTIHAKTCKLERTEIPTVITLTPEMWTPDTGLVTAALKLRRREIQNKFEKDIKRMYGKT